MTANTDRAKYRADLIPEQLTRARTEIDAAHSAIADAFIALNLALTALRASDDAMMRLHRLKLR